MGPAVQHGLICDKQLATHQSWVKQIQVDLESDQFDRRTGIQFQSSLPFRVRSSPVDNAVVHTSADACPSQNTLVTKGPQAEPQRAQQKEQGLKGTTHESSTPGSPAAMSNHSELANPWQNTPAGLNATRSVLLERAQKKKKARDARIKKNSKVRSVDRNGLVVI